MYIVIVFTLKSKDFNQISVFYLITRHAYNIDESLEKDAKEEE